MKHEATKHGSKEAKDDEYPETDCMLWYDMLCYEMGASDARWTDGSVHNMLTRGAHGIVSSGATTWSFSFHLLFVLLFLLWSVCVRARRARKRGRVGVGRKWKWTWKWRERMAVAGAGARARAWTRIEYGDLGGGGARVEGGRRHGDTERGRGRWGDRPGHPPHSTGAGDSTSTGGDKTRTPTSQPTAQRTVHTSKGAAGRGETRHDGVVLARRMAGR